MENSTKMYEFSGTPTGARQPEQRIDGNQESVPSGLGSVLDKNRQAEVQKARQGQRSQSRHKRTSSSPEGRRLPTPPTQQATETRNDSSPSLILPVQAEDGQVQHAPGPSEAGASQQSQSSPTQEPNEISSTPAQQSRSSQASNANSSPSPSQDPKEQGAQVKLFQTANATPTPERRSSVLQALDTAVDRRSSQTAEDGATIGQEQSPRQNDIASINKHNYRPHDPAPPVRQSQERQLPAESLESSYRRQLKALRSSHQMNGRRRQQANSQQRRRKSVEGQPEIPTQQRKHASLSPASHGQQRATGDARSQPSNAGDTPPHTTASPSQAAQDGSQLRETTTGSHQPRTTADASPSSSTSQQNASSNQNLPFIDLDIWESYNREGGTKKYALNPFNTLTSIDDQTDRLDAIKNITRDIGVHLKIIDVCPDGELRELWEKEDARNFSTEFLRGIRHCLVRTRKKREEDGVKIKDVARQALERAMRDAERAFNDAEQIAREARTKAAHAAAHLRKAKEVVEERKRELEEAKTRLENLGREEEV